MIIIDTLFVKVIKLFFLYNNLKMIKVADVFDTRQNPTKMKRIK